MDNNHPQSDPGQIGKNTVEANWYSLDNKYLTPQQKFEVEMWYQFPCNVSLIIFLCLLVYSSYYTLDWREIILITFAINIVAGVTI